MLVGCLESVTAGDVIFCGVHEYKPQPQRINYVSSVIRLMLVYTESPQHCVRRTFNSRDSNLYRTAVWIVPFREDYVNIYTASEIPEDFPTAPIPYIPFLFSVRESAPLKSSDNVDLRPVSLEKGQETLRLRVYACYAWGGPFLVAGLAALLDHLPPQPQYTFLRPRFGEKQCWFYGKFLTSSVEPLVISARTILWTRELAPSTRYPTSSPRHIIGSRQICISPEIIRNY
ncbi:putative G-protein coupled receptor Mth-like 1 [Trachymyrmex septentrionalis]|uniref:Putative G-protein coupled receptor Mth-like 1 n=1 Tax=Trachymyrmex septentrionalis TaxID=34720 RepID=A0A151JZ03_9HYME|nr:putative G-protein coupled receptor Mth-like 1 [Trachymyrmex septentrionalis]